MLLCSPPFFTSPSTIPLKKNLFFIVLPLIRLKLLDDFVQLEIFKYNYNFFGCTNVLTAS